MIKPGAVGGLSVLANALMQNSELPTGTSTDALAGAPVVASHSSDVGVLAGESSPAFHPAVVTLAFLSANRYW